MALSQYRSDSWDSHVLFRAERHRDMLKERQVERELMEHMQTPQAT